MTLGERVRDLRTNAGLSQVDLADRLQLPQRAVADWESDARIPDTANLERLADIFDVSVDDLLGGGEASALPVTVTINLSDYTKVKPARSRSDAAMIANFPRATAIYPLLRGKHLNFVENVVDVFVTGILGALDTLRDSSAYYLVEDGAGQWLANVTKEQISSVRLADTVGKKFVHDGSEFRRLTYVLK